VHVLLGKLGSGGVICNFNFGVSIVVGSLGLSGRLPLLVLPLEVLLVAVVMLLAPLSFSDSGGGHAIVPFFSDILFLLMHLVIVVLVCSCVLGNLGFLALIEVNY
jgi:hypothetical protein